MVLLRKEEYPEIETGEYIVQLIEIKETTSKRNPQFGPSIRFAFRILEQPYVNAVVSGLASAKLLAGNKLDKWLTGLGYEIEIGADLDTDALVGRIVRAYVERDEGSKYTNVKNIYALRDTDKSRIDAKAKLVDTAAAPAVATPATKPAVSIASSGTSAGSVDASSNVIQPAPAVPVATEVPAPAPAAPTTPPQGGSGNIPF